MLLSLSLSVVSVKTLSQAWGVYVFWKKQLICGLSIVNLLEVALLLGLLKSCASQLYSYDTQRTKDTYRSVVLN